MFIHKVIIITGLNKLLYVLILKMALDAKTGAVKPPHKLKTQTYGWKGELNTPGMTSVDTK